MRKDRPGPLVIVHCWDMNGEGGWSDGWKPTGKLTHVSEVGWMVEKTKTHVTLVRGITDTHDTEARGSGAPVTIPRSTIRLIQRLAEPRAKVDW